MVEAVIFTILGLALGFVLLFVFIQPRMIARKVDQLYTSRKIEWEAQNKVLLTNQEVHYKTLYIAELEKSKAQYTNE